MENLFSYLREIIEAIPEKGSSHIYLTFNNREFNFFVLYKKCFHAIKINEDCCVSPFHHLLLLNKQES